MKTLEGLILSILLALLGTFIDTEISKALHGGREIVEYKATPEQIDASRIKLCEYRQSCNLLAKAVYFEARGESVKGQTAVAHTILNRMNHDSRWPDTVKGVVFYRCQYTFTCDGSMKGGIKEKGKWATAKLVAWKALYGYSDDPTGGADHYLNERKVRRAYGKLPRWTRKYKRTVKIGNHTFYKGD